MKRIYLLYTLFILCFVSTTNAQEDQKLLAIDEPWRSETLSFPIHFAPSLDYKGIEEVRFAKGWGDKTSEEFWTYAFLWYLDEDPLLTETKLEKDIQAYFDGLMNLVGKGRGLTDIPESSAVFTENSTITTTVSNIGQTTKTYRGKAKFHDVFFTNTCKQHRSR